MKSNYQFTAFQFLDQTWCIPSSVKPALQRQKREDQDLKNSLGYLVETLFQRSKTYVYAPSEQRDLRLVGVRDRSPYVASAGLKLLICSPEPLQHWDYKCVPPHLTQSQIVCLSLPSAGIIGICHCTWLFSHIFYNLYSLNLALFKLDTILSLQ